MHIARYTRSLAVAVPFVRREKVPWAAVGECAIGSGMSALREQLLAVMDRKHHVAWPHLTRPGLRRDQLAVHFRHEYQTYVRDFPVLLARVYGQGPPEDVRAALAENIFEEQTGKLSLGASHPELFLELMAGI